MAEIPCVDQIPLEQLKSGQKIAVDGEKGTVEVLTGDKHDA